MLLLNKLRKQYVYIHSFLTVRVVGSSLHNLKSWLILDQTILSIGE